MALTRVVPIKYVRLSTDDIASLLKYISGFYRKPKSQFLRSYYSLSIDQDEHNSTTLDSPPRDFSPLLSTRIQSISLKIESREPNRKIVLRLTHGEYISYGNKIELHSDDEDWVNLTWQKLTDRIANFEPQPSLDTRKYKAAFVVLTLLIGWLMVSLLARVIVWISPNTPTTAGHQPVSTPWISLAGVAFGFGIWPADWLRSYARSAFPSIELQTGPAKSRIENIRRHRLNWVLGLFILAPSANLIYDIYRYLLGR